jgi:hypothetical protein
MTEQLTDRTVLEGAWQRYDAEFAEHVGEIVTPYEFIETDEQLHWVARIFMFAYGLGSVAGAQTAVPEEIPEEVDQNRVENIVDDVVDIHQSDEFTASAAGIGEDFLAE